MLTTFTNAKLSLRALDIAGEPWFLAKDVCAAIGIDTKDVRANLDSDEVCAVRLPGLAGRAPLLVSESGLYSLLMRSRKSEARPFQRWVTRDVLPAIRKRGAYMTAATADGAVSRPSVPSLNVRGSDQEDGAAVAERIGQHIERLTAMQDDIQDEIDAAWARFRSLSGGSRGSVKIPGSLTRH